MLRTMHSRSDPDLPTASSGEVGQGRAHAGNAEPAWPARVALVVLGGYQQWLSPLLPGACRFWPTCSEYARLALLRHGLVRGTGLALWRLCRCHRFTRGGIDPPP